MRLQGRVWKDGRFWLVEVPMLDAMTQGHSRREAFEMIADLVRTMANKPGFVVRVYASEHGYFEIGSDDVATLVAVMLRRLRQKHRVPLSEAARRLGSKSKTAYARYEQGRATPTVTKLFALLSAISPGEDFALSERSRSHRRAA
jgi:hypothetical protein